ncbi:DUF3572 domain-containing protein [Tropicimonas isoalkanivorans]|uniref:DUF3572 domain-containing protein n=1 Tax=Tropicimonas isoalkanivorans TaxID=441112 RepID=A0A1I1LAK1_9RHOB|nr:DUF3572 domain-containing protein [Tropicimonas isoalkanivorans]SFC70114.1 Protein of unknown function [Tropicimonas isoalkanivorans]
MRQESAETIGLQALAWVTGNDELLPVFLGASGTSLTDLKTRAGDPDFLAAVLDFVTMDDAWVVAFCDSAGIAYEVPLAARQALPGGSLPNWT